MIQNPRLKKENSQSYFPEHTRRLPATIQIATPKAVYLKFYNGIEAWIPKSTIKSEYDEVNKGEKATEQKFIIDSWVLKKNKVIPDIETE